MTVFTVSTFVTAGGTPYTLNTGDSLIIGTSGTLVATNVSTIGIYVQGVNVAVMIDGSFYAPAANSTGILVEGLNATGAIRVGASGSVYGTLYGASMSAGSSLDNAGVISGNNAVRLVSGSVVNSGEIRGVQSGVYATLDHAIIHNTGLIAATVDAVLVAPGGFDSDGQATVINEGSILGGVGANARGVVLGSSGALLQNDGQISGFTAVAFVASGDASELGGTLVNSGTIATTATDGLALAVKGSVLSDAVTNAGSISGTVSLLAGNDFYDGTEGRQLHGIVLGGDGADTLLGGAGADAMQGDAGADSLDGGSGNDILSGGTEADTLDGGAGNDILRGGAGADVIDGGEGAHDLLDYLGSGAVNVDLAAGGASGSLAQDDVFSGIEWLAGGGFDDTLMGDGQANSLFGRVGNDLLGGAGGNDVLVGDVGNDTLIGGAGVDVLRGGVGADIFRFLASSDSGAPGQVRDRIADFSHPQGDLIDFGAIDADTTLALNQAFAFNGTAAFDAAGQVRYQVISGTTFVFGNTDANLATSEFSIALSGAVALTAADFML